MPRRVEATGGFFARLTCWGPLWVALVGVAILWLLVDRVWWTLPFGYGPRWIWWPLVVIPLLSGCRLRERVAASLLTTVAILFVLQGFQLPFGGASTSAGAPSKTLRLITFNAGVNAQALPLALSLATRESADVLVVVECPLFRARVNDYRAIGVERSGEICVWQRGNKPTRIQHAIKPVRRIGWSGTIGVVRGIEAADGPIGVVHLRSVRNELSEFLDLSELLGQSDSMAARQQKRTEGSRFASQWFAGDQSGRLTIVVGDFNLVSESAVFHRDWGGWQDAFGAAGLGYGHTWRSSWYGLRIDHVLTDRSWQIRSARVGPDLGSDHLPLIVELIRLSGSNGE